MDRKLTELEMFAITQAEVKVLEAAAFRDRMLVALGITPGRAFRIQPNGTVVFDEPGRADGGVA